MNGNIPFVFLRCFFIAQADRSPSMQRIDFAKHPHHADSGKQANVLQVRKIF